MCPSDQSEPRCQIDAASARGWIMGAFKDPYRLRYARLLDAILDQTRERPFLFQQGQEEITISNDPDGDTPLTTIKIPRRYLVQVLDAPTPTKTGTAR
ncbi:hypothetical protein CKO28_00690 [Rhodovibrio sodomensis]|uniref:Uncharacterized protein n=1 Tax=Rhodovibrio sodomensis TaxID=1088 RepID=A0ABS1DAD2_9PROT|nr:hypothetical protein [Rhodovibrio sodomensis]MBK1666558.1 hypothetical protein [Rhodovibrio sodomensis]